MGVFATIVEIEVLSIAEFLSTSDLHGVSDALLLLLLAYLHLQEEIGHGLDVCVDGELDYAEDKKCHHDTLLKHNWVIHLVSVHQKSDLSHVLNDESTDKSLKEACVYK